jgi:predicted dehydrogenase
MTGKMQRRRFLKASAAAAGAGYFLNLGLTESRAQDSPNERLNIAIIGAGGRGAGNLEGVSRENIVAICDVDEQRAAGALNRHPNAARYKDFRVMLDKQKDIQAVVVSTADHTHAHASIRAMQMGKHCYTEKPLTHSVWEARQMAQVAAKNKVATQMGNQGTSSNGTRQAAEILRSGGIGEVSEVHVWTDRPGRYWRQGHTERPKERPPVPKNLDWDIWLGPAPERPYHPAYHPFAWRGWWDFGTGALGDMGCHVMNLAFMGLQLTPPTSVVAETDQPVNNESPPNGLKVTYEFPAREGRRALRMYWYEVRRPPADLFHGENIRGGGSLFVGTKGKMYCTSDYGDSYILLPRDNFKDYRPPAPTLPRSPGHHAEWIRACKGGPPAMSNFTDYSGPLTEIVLLGNVAIRAGQRIVWDSAKLQATNVPAAAQYVRREYRKGWELNM